MTTQALEDEFEHDVLLDAAPIHVRERAVFVSDPQRGGPDELRATAEVYRDAVGGFSVYGYVAEVRGGRAGTDELVFSQENVSTFTAARVLARRFLMGVER